MKPRYRIGLPLFQPDHVLPEGMYYRFQEREHLLMVISRNSASIPLQTTWLSKPAEFAFTLQEGILFFLAQFGHYPWRKASYYWHTIPPVLRGSPRQTENPDGSTNLQILFIDHLFGATQAIRKVEFTPKFTAILHGTIEQQATQPNMGRKAYQEALERVQEKYPTAKDLLKVSLAHMIDIPSAPLPWEVPYDIEKESREELEEKLTYVPLI